MTRLCAVPDCGLALGPYARGKVCRHHVHALPWCECAWCRGREAREAARVAALPLPEPERTEAVRIIHGCEVRHYGPEPERFLDAMERETGRLGP